jgi:hypothetical protein
VRGWTATVRPPVAFTQALKRRLFDSEHLSGSVSDYQLDHLLSLELGGSPRSLRNLWMQPEAQAHRDDHMENDWRRDVCAGRLMLRAAQRAEIAWKRARG